MTQFRSRLHDTVIALAVLGCALIGVGVWLHIDAARKAELRSAGERAELQARAFGEHADAVVRFVDLALIDLADAWSDWPSFHKKAETTAQRLGQLSVQIAATDERGVVTSTNLRPPTEQMSLADREHIRVHIDSLVDGLFISNPVVGRVSKQWSIQFTRAVRRQGKLVAVIVISVNPKFFSNFYDSLASPNKGDVVSMIKANGVVMARAPDGDKFLGQKITGLPYLEPNAAPAGHYRRVAVTDKVPRIYGWYKAPHSGLYLVAGLSEQSALQGFESQRLVLWFSAAALMALLLVSARVSMVAFRRRTEEALRFRSDNERLEQAVEARTAELSATVSELRASQAELLTARAALDSASEGIVIADARSSDWPMLYVNDAFERITGYSRAEAIGRSTRYLRGRDFDQPGFALLRDALQAGRPCRVQLRNYRKTGELFHNELSVSPLRNAAGEVTHFVGIQNDITHRVRMEDQLRESQKLEAIGQLTGGLAHDFNNLLGVVVGNLDLLGEKLPEDDGMRRQHRAALDAALRGAEVTRSLLAVARRQPLEVAVHDLNARVAEMLPLVRSSAGSAVTVRSQLWAGELPARVDEAGLSNAVLNLVINARDAMKGQAGEQRLVMRTRRERVEQDGDAQLAAGEYAVLEVEDSGPGMDEAVRQRAFEPFFTTKEAGRGTGLGLSMVRGFAEQLGGTARIDSTAGRGTVVRMYLPLRAATVAA